MPVSVNVTLTNPAHTVSYTLPSGAPASSLRELVVGVYAPSQPGTYPVIVYSHGHGGSSVSTQGAGLTAQALADLGYIVLMPNHLDSIALYPDWIRSQFTVFNPASGLHRAADMQFVLTQASDLAARLPPGYGVDLTSPVAAGHSNGAFTSAVLGGLTTGAASYDLQPGNPYGLTSVTDARFAALILISPQGQDTSWTRLGATAWDNITVPTLIITGDEDNEPLGGPGRWQGRLDAFRHSDHGSTLALVYRGAGHDDIGGNTDIPGLTTAITLGIDRFLDAWLRDDPAALAIVRDPSLLTGIDPLLFQAFARNLAGEVGQGVIIGTDASDVLTGLNSNDTLYGGAGTDRLFGGAGNDIFYVDVPSDLIFEAAGEGTDTVIASAWFYLYANIENLTLAAGSGDFFGVGNELANVITGNAGGNLLIAGGGIDTVNGGLGNDAIYGQDGADVLNGEAGIDYIVGGIGNDVIDGGADADNLFGEDGNDTLIGGTGFVTDIMTGGAGNDILRGDSGLGDYDLMDGGADNDSYYVDTGDDLTFEAVGGGIDTVYADVRVTNGGVYLYANVENLVLIGTTAFGVGNELNNVLTGNASGNYLLGGAGADTINGGAGNDVLFGEAGNDVFAFSVGSGGDVIGDFQLAGDRMDVSAFFTSFAQAQANFSQVGGDGAINLGNGDFIVLHGVTMANLTAGHFIFGGAGAPVEPEAKDGGPIVLPGPAADTIKGGDGREVLPGVMDDGFIPGIKSDDDGREVLPGAADREGLDLFDLDGIVGDRAWTGLEHRLAILNLDFAGSAPGSDEVLAAPLPEGQADWGP